MSGLPPRHVEAEQELIGCLLAGPHLLPEVALRLAPADLTQRATSAALGAMLEADQAGEPISAVTLAERMAGAFPGGESQAIGWLMERLQDTATAAALWHYVGRIADAAARRRLWSAAERMQQLAADPETGPDSALDRAGDLLAGCRQVAEPRQPIAVAMAQVRADLIQRDQAPVEQIPGLASGFYDLDEATGGMHPGALILLGARPGMGKSAFASEVAINVASQGVPVLFFSAEMDAVSLALRAVAARAGVDGLRLKMGRLRQYRADGQREIDAALATADALASLPIDIDDSSDLSVREVRQRSRAWRRKVGDGPALVVADYLQLLQGEESDRRRRDWSREREVGEHGRALRALAKQLRLPVLALAQLSRAVEEKGRRDKRPRVADLRESGALEQHADLILLLYRDEVYKKDSPDKGIAEVIIGKQRNGPTGTVRLGFERACTRFYNLARAAGQQGTL